MRQEDPHLNHSFKVQYVQEKAASGFLVPFNYLHTSLLPLHFFSLSICYVTQYAGRFGQETGTKVRWSPGLQDELNLVSDFFFWKIQALEMKGYCGIENAID